MRSPVTTVDAAGRPPSARALLGELRDVAVAVRHMLEGIRERAEAPAE